MLGSVAYPYCNPFLFSFPLLSLSFLPYIYPNNLKAITYDHRLRTTGHPVRSAFHKLQIGGLVVRWVTTSEYPLLYVL